MNKYHFFSLIFFIGAIIFFVLGFLEGSVEGGIFIIFPFIFGSGIFALIGIVFIFLTIIFYIFGFVSLSQPSEKYPYEKEPFEKKKSLKGGGIVLIGPIPIIFGSSWKIAVVLMILAIIIIIVSLFYFRII